MAITDNKVTATPTTTGVGSAGDLLIGSTPAELAANKAIFDAFPDAIKTKHDALIDYIDAHPFYYESSVAAATASKGSFSGWIPTGAIIDLVMTNGNTAVSPTLTIDSVVYTITGMPTVAKVTGTNAVAQAYKLKKTGATALVFVTMPDYVCEAGVSGNFRYKRMASGESELFMVTSTSSGTLSMAEVSTSGFYVSGDITLTVPVGIFNGAGYTAVPSVFSNSYVIGINVQYSSCSATELVFVINKSGSSTSAVSFRFHIVGTWR